MAASDHKTFLQKLDPRVKLLIAVIFTALVFIVNTLPVAAGQMIVLFILCIAARIPVKKMFPQIKFLIFFIAVVAALQILFGNGPLSAMMLACRIITLNIIMPLLTRTTETRLLALGMTRLGFNYKTSYIITSTLNLIPSFVEDAQLIMDARRLRKPPVKRSFLGQFREYTAVAFPLVIKAMKRSLSISMVMDARAFGAYPKRTWLREIRMSFADYAALSAGIIYSAAVLAVNFGIRR